MVEAPKNSQSSRGFVRHRRFVVQASYFGARKRLQSRPDVVQQQHLGLCIRVDAIALHQFIEPLGSRNAFEQERHQRGPRVPGDLCIERLECLRITGTQVRRHLHAGEQRFGTSGEHGFGHGEQVGTDRVDGVTAQAVVAAEFNDNDVRFVDVERLGQPG